MRKPVETLSIVVVKRCQKMKAALLIAKRIQLVSDTAVYCWHFLLYQEVVAGIKGGGGDVLTL